MGYRYKTNVIECLTLSPRIIELTNSFLLVQDKNFISLLRLGTPRLPSKLGLIIKSNRNKWLITLQKSNDWIRLSKTRICHSPSTKTPISILNKLLRKRKTKRHVLLDHNLQALGPKSGIDENPMSDCHYDSHLYFVIGTTNLPHDIHPLRYYMDDMV